MLVRDLPNLVSFLKGFYVTFLILMLICGKASNLQDRKTRTGKDGAGCNESVATREVVFSCPRTAQEWRKRSENKNCTQFKHTCSSFEYHCVLNAWMNETIEVCAPKKIIVGKACAEFNSGGNVIQRHSRTNCTECPIVYNSVDSFLYQECYEYVRKYRRSQKITISLATTDISASSRSFEPSVFIAILTSTWQPCKNYRNNSSKTESNTSMVVAVTITAAVGTVIVLLLHVLMFVYRRCNNKERTIPKSAGLASTQINDAECNGFVKLPTSELYNNSDE